MIHVPEGRGTLFPAAVTRTRRRKLTAAAVAIAVVATPGLASAAIVSPPPAPLEIVVFTERDFVVIEGGPANQALTFNVIRNGVTIGTASSGQVSPAILTSDPDGILEVNHPGGLCWSGVSPNLLPGDRVEVVDSATPTNGFAVTAQNVTAGPAVEIGATVEVRGIARNANGTPMALSRVEQRIVEPAFREPPEPLEKRDIRATVADGNLVRDPGVSGGWIATHRGLSPVQRQKALGGGVRGMAWQGTNAAGDRLGITIFEVGEPGGPGFGGCPQRADFAITAARPGSVRLGNTGLTLGGTSNDATSVRVTLRDTNPATANLVRSAVPRPATGAQTFRVTFTKAQIARLRDGRLTAVGSYATGGGRIGGVNKSIIKDTAVPNSPRTDTRSGSYARAQSVTLSLPRGEGRSKIFYTTNGRAPNRTSLRAVRPIRITASKTLRAIVVDPAGNKSVSSCALRRGCWQIAIDDNPTRVTSRSPRAGATGVSRRTNVQARFSEAMRSPSIGRGTMILRRDVAGAPRIRARVSYNAGSRTVTLNPGKRLRANKAYRVVMTSGIKDRTRTHLVAKSWTFRTGR